MAVITARPTRRSGRGGFLPKGTPDLLRRLGCQIAGAALIGVALGYVGMMGSYHGADSSSDTASTLPVLNWLGPVGAWFSDALLQWLGTASWLPGIAILLWGGRTVAASAFPDHLRLRIGLLVLALPLTAVGMATIPMPGWLHLPIASVGAHNFGGIAGSLIAQGLTAATKAAGMAAAGAWIARAVGLCGVAQAVYSFGLSREEWMALGRMARAVSRTGAITARWLGKLDFHRAGAVEDYDAVEVPRREPLLRRLVPTLGAPGRGDPGRGDPEQDDTIREQPRRMLRREPKLVVDADDQDDDDIAEILAEPVLKRPHQRPLPPPDLTIEPEREKPVVEPRIARPAPEGKHAEQTRQGSLKLVDEGTFRLPPLDLLAPPPANKGEGMDEEQLTKNAQLLESVLDDFGVNGQVTKVRPGPVVTLYELEPAPGTKTSRVIGLADDISRQMSALSVRIATVPGRSVIGIEMPNAKRELVALRELLASEAFERTASPLTLVLGKDIGGQPMMVDLARMPHLLIAGTTGSGKSVAINTMILSLLYRLTPDQCRLIMIDPKMLELSVYDGIPHLLAPVVTEPGKAVVALKWAVREMENRYRMMSQLGVRNIAGYNQRLLEAAAKGEPLTRRVHTGYDPETDRPIYEEQALPHQTLPFIVIIVDEMADLMLVAGKDIEGAVQRLAQMARAAGIHLIMATQRPSVDVITGTIKANFPSRVSFQVTSKIDSRTILGEQGAEQLLGQGDMLYMAAGGRIIRVHGPFVSDQEVEHVTNHLREQGEPSYVEEVTAEEVEEEEESGDSKQPSDELYDEAVSLVLREGKASTSFVQRHLQIGYNRAARMIERMEREGIVSKSNQMGKREVLKQ